MISPIIAINNHEYCKKICKSQTLQKDLPQKNEIQLSNYKAGQAILARNNICFKNILHEHGKVLPKSYSYDIYQVEESIQPYITAEITCNSDIPRKEGIKGVYLFALYDQISEQQDDKIEYIASGVDINSRGLVLTCGKENVLNTLRKLDTNFINVNISPQHIKEAKQIAPVGLFLSRKTDEYKKEFDDILTDMPEEEYEKIIAQITEEDIHKFNNEIIKNSDVKVNIVLNSKDYKELKDNINNFYKWRYKNENFENWCTK